MLNTKEFTSEFCGKSAAHWLGQQDGMRWAARMCEIMIRESEQSGIDPAILLRDFIDSMPRRIEILEQLRELSRNESGAKLRTN